MSRTLAREDAFKLIFEMRTAGTRLESGIAYLCETAQKDDDMWAQQTVSENNLNYIQSVLNGIEDNLESINNLISSKLKKWTIDRISKVNLAILQLAVYEIVYEEDIPDKVAVNEAVNLGKKYGDEGAGTFINGVLGAIISEKD